MDQATQPDTTHTAVILLADDDEFCRTALSKYLKLCGYAVVECSDGNEASGRLLRERFDCAVVDYHLPGRSVCTIVNDARHAGHDTPFVIVTGDESPQTERAARSLSPVFYFLKPFLPSDLKAVIDRLLEGAARPD